MSDFGAEKQAIRKQLLAARQQNPKPADFSLFALELLQSHPGLVASYFSTETEPETSAINQHLANLGRLVLPAIQSSSLVWKKPESLIPSQFGIMAPVGPSVSISEISLILAPALAVTKNGHRLGKGGGYYDRALEKFSGDVYAIVFEREVLHSLPVEDHDRQIQGAITETGLRDF